MGTEPGQGKSPSEGLLRVAWAKGVELKVAVASGSRPPEEPREAGSPPDPEATGTSAAVPSGCGPS